MFSIKPQKRVPVIWLLIALIGICGTLSFAQNRSGAIEGTILDAKTGEPLIGVNIVVLGTYLGTSTDMNGRYLISNIKPAEYSLEVSYIGYKIIQKTGASVEAGQNLVIDFEMEQTALALGQEIVVIGERPLIQFDETGTVRSISRDDIANKPLENVQDIISQQVGVTKQDDEIHIRGSRTYEVQYLLDDISVQDPLSGTGFGLNISANAIEEVEVITGGFRAEYGQATSGVVNVKTKSGSDRYEGYASYKSDHLGLFRSRPWSFNSDVLEMNFGGPGPLTSGFLPYIGLNLPGKFYFFVNLYSMMADDFTGATANQLSSSISPRLNLFGTDLLDATSLAPRQNNQWNGLYKLTWKLDETHRLVFSYNRSIVINQNTQSLQTNLEYVEPGPGFPYNYSQNLDNFNTYTHDNEQASLSWSHTLNQRTFYELKFSQYWAHLRSDIQGTDWADMTFPADVSRLPVEYYTPSWDPTKVRIIPGDGFYDYGNSSFWHDHFVESYLIRGDITSKIGNVHSLKGGFESSFSEMQLIDIVDPWMEGGFGSSQDMYRVFPADGALYAQDDIKFEGFYLNVGLRLDYWFPGKYVDDAIGDEANILTDEMRQQYQDNTYQLFGRHFKMRLMPRLGVSHPISDNQMLFFNTAISPKDRALSLSMPNWAISVRNRLIRNSAIPISIRRHRLFTSWGSGINSAKTALSILPVTIKIFSIMCRRLRSPESRVSVLRSFISTWTMPVRGVSKLNIKRVSGNIFPATSTVLIRSPRPKPPRRMSACWSPRGASRKNRLKRHLPYGTDPGRCRPTPICACRREPALKFLGFNR